MKDQNNKFSLCSFILFLLASSFSLNGMEVSISSNANIKELNKILSSIEQNNTKLEKEINLEVKDEETFKNEILTKMNSIDEYKNSSESIDKSNERKLKTVNKRTKKHRKFNRPMIKIYKNHKSLGLKSKSNRRGKFNLISTNKYEISNLKSNKETKMLQNNNRLITSIIKDNPEIESDTLKNYLKDTKQNLLPSINQDHINDTCREFQGIIYQAKITNKDKVKDTERILELKPYYITLNSFNLILSNHKDLKFELKPFIISLNQIEKITPLYNKLTINSIEQEKLNKMKKRLLNKEDKIQPDEVIPRCFTIQYHPLDYTSELFNINFCDISFDIKKDVPKRVENDEGNKSNDNILLAYSNCFFLEKIIKLKECRYKGEIIFTNANNSTKSSYIKDLSKKIQIKLNNSISDKNLSNNNLYLMNKELDKMNVKKSIQEKYLKQISDLFEESDVEQMALQREFLLRMNEINKKKEEMNQQEHEILKDQNSNSDNNGSSVLAEENITNLQQKLEKQFVNMIKEVKKNILESKVKQIEEMRKKFNSIIDQNEFLAKMKTQNFMNEYDSKLRIETKNECTDSKVKVNDICEKLFGLSGKEVCISDAKYFCNRCCGFYIGVKYEKELSDCLNKCKVIRN